MFSLYDMVILLEPASEDGPAAGTVGSIVDIYTKPREAYEVEFVDSCGRTLALLAVDPHKLKLAK
jgi:hypothetical protein